LTHFVLARQCILALADALLALGSAALALCIALQRELAVEFLQRRPPLTPHLRHARRNGETLRARRLVGARAHDDVGALAFNAAALGGIVVGSQNAATHQQCDQPCNRRGAGSAKPLAVSP
jgi:hypothetical protein